MMGLQGKYLFSTGQRTEGLELVRKAVEIQPGNLGLWNDLQMLSALAGNLQSSRFAGENIDRIDRFVQRGRKK